MFRRVLRLVLALACPLLATAILFNLDAQWTIPLFAVCLVNTVILIARDKRRRDAEDTVVLDLHR